MKVRRELKRRLTVPRVFGSGTQLTVLSVFGTGDEKAPMRHESNTRNADMTDERKVWGNYWWFAIMTGRVTDGIYAIRFLRTLENYCNESCSWES
jgi:hypothetical protein